MSTSDPDEQQRIIHEQLNNAGNIIPSSGTASDYVNLEALAGIANQLMNAMPPAWKETRGGYAADLNEVVLKNLPERMKNSDFVVPTEDQLHRLPETIARGDTPNTPQANRDVGMSKTMDVLRAEQIENIPFGFLREMRAVVPVAPEEWSAPLASSMAVMPAAMERTAENMQMAEMVRALEKTGDASMPQMRGVKYDASSAGGMSDAFSFLGGFSHSVSELSNSARGINAMMPAAGGGSSIAGWQPALPGSGSSSPYFKFMDEQAANPFINPLIPDPLSAQASTAGSTPGNLTAISFDVQRVRRDFPILQEKVNGRNLIWLDNAATTQKPQAVIDRLSYFYRHENSNIHRAAHELAARSTDAYEGARESVRRFLNASSTSEIIFVRGATEAINLVAQTWGRQNIQKDDEILITWLEHHANIVPWQMLAAATGARLRVVPVDDRGDLLLDEYQRLLNPRTKLVSFTHVSNALGTVTPVAEMVAAAHRIGAKVLVDGAQSVSHMRVDMQYFDCDFFAFSGHKIFAPTGIGVLYGKQEVLESMPPWHGGGNMIKDVTFERTLYQSPPVRFEAGTGSIADAVGLGAALDYIDHIGMHNITRHENALMAYASELMARIPGLRPIGTPREKAGVLSFVLDGYTTEQVSKALNEQGIAVRAGHHCAQPILRRFGLESTVRPSLAVYNTHDDIDALVDALWNLKQGRTAGLF